MMENKLSQINGGKQNDELAFEAVKDDQNVVKVISYDGVKKHEVYVYVLSEEQFDALIPSSEKENSKVFAG